MEEFDNEDIKDIDSYQKGQLSPQGDPSMVQTWQNQNHQIKNGKMHLSNQGDNQVYSTYQQVGTTSNSASAGRPRHFVDKARVMS